MRTYFSSNIELNPDLDKIEIGPSSNGPKTRPIRLIFKECKMFQLYNYNVKKISDNTLLFQEPTQQDNTDNRILAVVDVPQPRHRRDGRMLDCSPIRPLMSEQGYGAWGSGAVYAVVLSPGEWIAFDAPGGRVQVIHYGAPLTAPTPSNFSAHVIQYPNNSIELLTDHTYESIDEFKLAYGLVEGESI